MIYAQETARRCSPRSFIIVYLEPVPTLQLQSVKRESPEHNGCTDVPKHISSSVFCIYLCKSTFYAF